MDAAIGKCQIAKGMRACFRSLFFLMWHLSFVVSLAYAQEEFYHPELTWRTIETEHFFVHYHDGAERTARVVAKIAEDVYEPITTLYNHRPEQKVSFVIKDYDDYSNGAAYFYDNIVEIWASSMDFDLRGTHNWLRNVVTHEFTHIVQIQTSMKFGRRIPGVYLQWLGYEAERRPDVLYGYPNVIASYPISGFVVPAWFAEGVAQYSRPELAYDSWDSHRDMILRMSALDGNMLTWNEMAVFGKTSLGNESAYNMGFAFVKFIAERYGIGKLREISDNLSSLTELTIDGAIKRAVGKDGEELYNEWVAFLRDDYAARTAHVKANTVGGTIIADVGFGNFYPTFSPDGTQLAYISNKEADYFAQSSIYLYNLRTKQEKKLVDGVRSNLSWSPDGKAIYYTKTTRRNKFWSDLHDIYMYDLEQDEETRLTYGLRANAPSVSPDGKNIAYVAGKDGTLNLFVMDSEGNNRRQLTAFSNGEQVYNPKWSPDGSRVVFDYSIKDGRDIAIISREGGEVEFLIEGESDDRNPVFTGDGNRLLLASDRTGVFNIYEHNMMTGETRQVTNVLGGAFMPTVTSEGALAFATYTSKGYKIALIDGYRPLEDEQNIHYVRARNMDRQMSADFASGTHSSHAAAGDWSRLRFYDDTQLTDTGSKEYRNIFTSMLFVPFLRVDNYNPKNRGIDIVKPGVYAFSRDVLDKLSLFAGGAINRKFEYDLFFILTFNDRFPGLFDLGLDPRISFEVYNIARKTDINLGPFIRHGLSAPTDITYDLVEFNLVLRQRLFLESLDAEVRYNHSRYSSAIGNFFLYDSLGDHLVGFYKGSRDLYYAGNNLSLSLRYTAIVPSRTQEINPVGRKILLRYDHEFSRFNPTYEVNEEKNELVRVYKRPNYHRLELDWREQIRLPGWKHTLSARVRGGSILGPPVDDFFDFYIGGLVGMKGYPFYSLGGNEMAAVNLTYRFPLLEKIDLRILHLYFDKLYAAVFGDVGDAWTGGGLKGKKFKRDVGVELRLEAFSWYSYPTRIFLTAAYGFDRFNHEIRHLRTTVTYGKEWRFYFGVLFGFDID